MANFVYTKAKHLLLAGDIDFDEAGDDIRVLLVMTNTTIDTEEDEDFIGDFTTLDEYDGANYARQTIDNQVTAEDEANDRGEFDGDNVTIANLGVGTRQCQALLIFHFVTNDADSVPIAYIDQGGFPFDGNGGNVTITWNAEGIIQAT